MSDYKKLLENFNNCEMSDNKIIIKADLLNFVELIKNHYGFDILKEIIAIDNREHGIELIYSFYSTQDEESLLLSYTTETEASSISSLFDSAVADEKEIFDLFGINFIGNRELKRLYMPDSWQGYPLKKDYVENDERLNWND